MNKFKITVCIIFSLCVIVHLMADCGIKNNCLQSIGQARAEQTIQSQVHGKPMYSGSINIIEKYVTLLMIFFIMGLYIKKKNYCGIEKYHMIK